MKDKRVIRASIGALVGIMVIVALVWLLVRTLGNAQFPALYAGRTMDDWNRRLASHDAGISNAAYATINSTVIPQLVETMFHDTNDSALRVSLVRGLNGLPGVHIAFMTADLRRGGAAASLGELGPFARPAIPDLIKAAQGNDSWVKSGAISSLGRTHSEPERLIPFLIPYLSDENLDVPAAFALAEFGPLAKPATPKLLLLLKSRDKDDRDAGGKALLKIDPEAAKKAGVKPRNSGSY